MRPVATSFVDPRAHPILYVDDTPDSLRIFELNFRSDFTIFTAASAEAGLALLNENPIAVVLSDHRMPGMSGVEFLSRVRVIAPHAIRMLVTAYGNAETLASAINDGSIDRYVPKPWEPEELRLTIRQAIEAVARDRERDALVEQLTRLDRLARELHRERAVSPIVDCLLTALTRDLGYDGAALLLFDEAGDRLTWAGIEPRDAVADALRQIAIERGNAREFIEDLECGATMRWRAEGLTEFPRALRSWLTEVCADDTVVVPIRGAQRVIGALAVDNRRGGAGLGGDDERLLQGVAAQCAIALENARHVEALRGAEADARRRSRIGTLGEVAGTLAHAIDAPLAALESVLSSEPARDAGLLTGVTPGEPGHPVRRLRGLVRAMQGAAGGRAASLGEVTPLRELVDGARARVRDDFARAGLRLVRDEIPGQLRVAGARNQLQRLLVNLFDNARAATRPGGEVRVACSCEPGPEGEIVSLRVEDTGRGVAEADLGRIFDPFFTTDDAADGRGLGLAVCQQIVAALGGELRVESRPGEGATFVVRLPAKPAAASLGASSA